MGDLLAASCGTVLDRSAVLRIAKDAPLPDLLAAARQRRAHGKGSVVSFSKKVFIPLTTLCRDYCGYCTFRKDPGQPGAHFMTPDEVLALTERAREAGCKEALFSLGDQPERIFPEARDFLRQQGFARTLDYAAAMCEMVLERTGLLPHANPGVMDRAALERFKDSNASVGLMLETVSTRLMRNGLAHFKAPDKVPALRLRTIEEAGKLSMAFTTGILIGIGETVAERALSLTAIRDSHERHGHIQEVIIQNFRAKPEIVMADAPEPDAYDMARAIATARLVLGPAMNVQAPPNLSPQQIELFLKSGINDWGGISPLSKDYVNPEAPWPHLERLGERCERAGFRLIERLAIYPEYIDDKWLDPAIAPRVRAMQTAIEPVGGQP